MAPLHSWFRLHRVRIMKTNRRQFLQRSLLSAFLAYPHALYAGVILPFLPRPDSLQALSPYLDTLIPEDESPSATHLQVDQQILDKARRGTAYRRLLNQGCRWLDREARRLGSKDFTSLSPADRETIVKRAAAEKPGTLPRKFFDITRDAAMGFYYAHAESWKGLGYPGPPQPLGFVDHTQPPMKYR